MLVKKESGVTLLILIITIIILAIIVTIVVRGGLKIIDEEYDKTILTNMLLIQSQCKVISEKANFEKNDSLYVGTSMTAEEVNSLVGSNIVVADASDKYYKLVQENLNQLNLGNISLTGSESYVVNYATDEIIYPPGCITKTGTYYKLSELKDL